MDNDALVCPLDSRRGATEVLIKRIAVTVTVLTMLGHLNSLRRVRGAAQLIPSVYLTLMNPVYPILKLLFGILYALIKVGKDIKHALLQWYHRHVEVPLAWLPATAPACGPASFYALAAIGAHTRHAPVALYDLFQKADSTPLLHLRYRRLEREFWEIQPVLRSRPTNGGVPQLGRLVVLFAATVQCSLTLVLGIRREARDAASPMDRRTTLMAGSGLVLLLQTLIAQTVQNPWGISPGYYEESSDLAEYTSSIVVEVIHYAVSLFLVTRYAGDEWYFPIYASVIFLFLAMDDEDELRDLTLSDMYDPAKRWGIVGALVMVLFWVSSAAACLILLYYKPASDHFTDALGHLAPTDQPCPLLWKDPLADTLWAF